jgi:hypothetical protein
MLTVFVSTHLLDFDGRSKGARVCVTCQRRKWIWERKGVKRQTRQYKLAGAHNKDSSGADMRGKEVELQAISK